MILCHKSFIITLCTNVFGLCVAYQVCIYVLFGLFEYSVYAAVEKHSEYFSVRHSREEYLCVLRVMRVLCCVLVVYSNYSAVPGPALGTFCMNSLCTVCTLLSSTE